MIIVQTSVRPSGRPLNQFFLRNRLVDSCQIWEKLPIYNISIYFFLVSKFLIFKIWRFFFLNTYPYGSRHSQTFPPNASESFETTPWLLCQWPSQNYFFGLYKFYDFMFYRFLALLCTTTQQCYCQDEGVCRRSPSVPKNIFSESI